MVLRSLSLALFVFPNGLLMASWFASYSPVWQEQIVAARVEFGHLAPPSLALNPDGYPHLGPGHSILFHISYDDASAYLEPAIVPLKSHRNLLLVCVNLESGQVLLRSSK